MGIDIGHLPFVLCSSFSDKMIGNTLGFLLQHQVRDGHIGQHWLIVSIDEHGIITRDTHHPQFVSQSMNIFTALFHCYEIRQTMTPRNFAS